MFQFVLTDICRSFLRVSKVTEKIKTRLKPTLSENFNSHPLYFLKLCMIWMFISNSRKSKFILGVVELFKFKKDMQH
jgi:hypothetical protein